MLAGVLAAVAATTILSFQDPAIVESSALVDGGDGLLVTVNDSGDAGRLFVVDGSGRTVGTTRWAPDPVDVEALAPAGPGEVWVGDTGDNTASRKSIRLLRVQFGRGDREVTPAAYELTYPDGAHDAETLLAQPRTGRLFVVTKELLGGTVYAVPRRLRTDRPNRLRAVADSVPIATDGAFFPDGRHYVVRGYGSATVFTFPGHRRVASFALPAQRQGEGLAVGAHDELYLSSEGEHAAVLRMRLPPAVSAAMAPPTPPTPSPSPSPSARPVDDSAPGDVIGGGVAWWAWPAGAFVLVFVAGLGWLLLRRGQAP